MTAEEAMVAQPPRRGVSRGGCLLRVAIAIVAVIGLIVLVGETFDQGDDADQPIRGFVAGQAEAFERGDVNQFPSEHTFVTRLADGAFIALYDRSPRAQELNNDDCLIFFDETASLGTLEPLPGIDGGFVEDCDGARTVWRADGVFAFGAGYQDVPMDSFGTTVTGDGELIVDTRNRSCTRSRGTVGIPPFVERQCRGAG
jgi:hypothetical protein